MAMLLVDKFVINQSRRDAFNILLTLKKYYPGMELTYRDGRRREDYFKDESKPLSDVCYDKIKHSGEWRLFLNCEQSSIVSFRFIKHQLQPFSVTECLLQLPIIQSSRLSKINIVFMRLCALVKRVVNNTTSSIMKSQ